VLVIDVPVNVAVAVAVSGVALVGGSAMLIAIAVNPVYTPGLMTIDEMVPSSIVVESKIVASFLYNSICLLILGLITLCDISSVSII
jgi:hypothetical protein